MIALMAVAVSVQAAFLPAKRAAEPPRYDLRIISEVTTHSFAMGINNAGTVAVCGDGGGYAVGKNHVTDLGPGSWPSAVNDRGVVCGQQDMVACYWPTKGEPIMIGPPTDSVANAINNRNVVVGGAMIYSGFSGSVYPFVFDDGKSVLLSNESGTALAVNENGLIGGNVYRSGESWSMPCLWQKRKGVYIQIDLPLPTGAVRGYVLGLDEAGQPVGCCVSLQSGRIGATTWGYSRGVYTAYWLPGVSGLSYWAMGANSWGQVVGYDDSSACLWERGQVYDLNSLVVSGDSGCRLFAAMAINDAGQISCRAYYYATGCTVAVLLTPSRHSKPK